MRSWWDLGEGYGQLGDSLAIYQIECAFCNEKGDFKIVSQFQKKNPQSNKMLHFDTLRCENCVGYVMVLWSTDSSGGGTDLHDYKVLPWPIKIGEGSKHWPDEIKRFWKQAHSSIIGENWDAAALMARSALQAIMRDQKAVGKYLFNEIEDLSKKGQLPPIMKEFAEEVRELGNNSAHPKAGNLETSPKDAKDIVEFLDIVLDYLYDLPKKINDYRSRKNK